MAGGRAPSTLRVSLRRLSVRASALTSPRAVFAKESFREGFVSLFDVLLHALDRLDTWRTGRCLRSLLLWLGLQLVGGGGSDATAGSDATSCHDEFFDADDSLGGGGGEALERAPSGGGTQQRSRRVSRSSIDRPAAAAQPPPAGRTASGGAARLPRVSASSLYAPTVLTPAHLTANGAAATAAAVEVDENEQEQDAFALPRENWADGDSSLFVLRGANYLRDRIKIAASTPALSLASVDLFDSPTPVDHISAHPNSWVGRRRAELGGNNTTQLPFVLCVNFMNPGSPGRFHPASLALYFTAPPGVGLEQLLSTPCPLASGLRRFISAGADERRSMFKAIAAITDGPLLVRKMVPRTPFIVAKNVRCPVHSSHNLLEIAIDVASSAVGDRFYRRVHQSFFRFVFVLELSHHAFSRPALSAPARHVMHRYTSQVDVTLAFLIEGQREDELPEALLGVARLTHVAPQLALPLDGAPR